MRYDMNTQDFHGWFADFDQQNFYYGKLSVENGRIQAIEETGEIRLTWDQRDQVRPVILPGLIDSHVHIESSMLMPSRFAMQAVRFGTVATVSDPHEIANVLGLPGIRLMLQDAGQACFKIYFTAPSCVPATMLETAGANLKAEDLNDLFVERNVVALGEMMNYPGVLASDPEVIDKLNLAKRYGKRVDGHAPGLSGPELDLYIQAGIDTDHECSEWSEAEEKIQKGMKVLIREGSSARNFEKLYPLIDKYPGSVMLCTDDYHPDDLMVGHINLLVNRAISKGLNFFYVYQAASLNPVKHYNLDTGLLNVGDSADFIIANGLEPLEVMATYIQGKPVFINDMIDVPVPSLTPLNLFNALPVSPADIMVFGESGLYRVIRAWDGELLTGSETATLLEKDGIVNGVVNNDILKIVVLNRYEPSKPAVGWISGFGLKKGAMASSIAHDSHNIIAVGASDSDIVEAINQIILHKGGIVCTESGNTQMLELPVAGLMSLGSAAEVGVRYALLSRQVKEFGSPLKAPFMALSFMALLVIPHLKIGDKGLFDCGSFKFISLKAD